MGHLLKATVYGLVLCCMMSAGASAQFDDADEFPDASKKVLTQPDETPSSNGGRRRTEFPQSVPPQTETPANPSPNRRSTRQPDNSPQRAISHDGGASVNPELLEKIRDNTIGLLPEDREAYYLILKLTEKLDPQELQLLAAEFKEERHAAVPKTKRPKLQNFPTFGDMFLHPDAYRGRPVTLHGKIRRLISYESGSDNHGVEQLYEGWFYADGGQGNPAVVIFTDLPEDFPLGSDIEEEASVTGYFLKMYGYAAQDTTRRAPLILAHTIRWHPQKLPKTWAPEPQTYIAFAVGVFVLGVLVYLMLRESRREEEFWKQSRRAKLEDISVLRDLSVSSYHEPSQNGRTIEPHH